MDMGDLTSRQIGEATADGVLRAEEQLMEEQLSGQAGIIPATIKNQNLGSNAKKEALGPNTKQKR